MPLIGSTREVVRQEVGQDICSPLMGRYRVLMDLPLLASAKCDPGMVLTRTHHPGQYVINACFQFGSKIVELVFLSQILGLIVVIAEVYKVITARH